MIPVLWHSNSGWAPTGYGNQVGLFAPRLKDHYRLAISAFYGLEGARTTWQGIDTFPGLGGEFGNDYVLEHARRWFEDDLRSGILLTLMDVWVLNPAVIAKANAASWVPVDHDPTPPAVVQFFRESGSVPIAMSKFGQEQLGEFDPLYVPHGVDTEAFKPSPRGALREKTGVPEDAFLVGMVAANKGAPSRKGFQQAFEAFRYFREKHDDALLYLHTCMNPKLSQGEDLAGILASLQIPEDAVLIADQYRMSFDPFPAKSMGQIYSTMDCLLNPAQGEGFGIPVLEAQACGVPAIVTDFSAMKEVCGAGWKVKCRPLWTGQKSWQAIADVGDIVGALEDCYGLSKSKRKALSSKARDHALGYAADTVLDRHFLPALRECAERFGLDDDPTEGAKVKPIRPAIEVAKAA